MATTNHTVFLNQVHCKGYENKLMDCKHKFGDNVCRHNEDVLLTCGEFWLPTHQGVGDSIVVTKFCKVVNTLFYTIICFLYLPCLYSQVFYTGKFWIVKLEDSINRRPFANFTCHFLAIHAAHSPIFIPLKFSHVLKIFVTKRCT